MPLFTGSIENLGNADTYDIQLISGRTYYFELEGEPTGGGTLADGYLRLYSPDFSLLAFDDDGGVGANSRLVYTATSSGIFQIEASGWEDLYTGSYFLSAFEDDLRSTNEGTGSLGAVATGGSATGTINYSGDADLFGTTLIAGLTYNISQRGSGTGDGTLVDPLFYLLSSGGATLAANDNDASTLNSLISYQAVETGTHFLRAEVGDDAGTGSYNVFVSAGQGTNVTDIIVGTGIGDAISGLRGDDNIRGLSGNDALSGGSGADVLIGGLGADTFRFLNAAGNVGAQRDQIRAGDGAGAFHGVGNAAGDLIDLAGIDANTGIGGNQTFLFGGTGRGQLTLVNERGATVIHGNIDNDAAYEFDLLIADGTTTAGSYTAADFVL